jgi:hypothetical protein
MNTTLHHTGFTAVKNLQTKLRMLTILQEVIAQTGMKKVLEGRITL